MVHGGTDMGRYGMCHGWSQPSNTPGVVVHVGSEWPRELSACLNTSLAPEVLQRGFWRAMLSVLCM